MSALNRRQVLALSAGALAGCRFGQETNLHKLGKGHPWV